MKKISILIPCYNEESNVVPMSEALNNLFLTKLSMYDYEIVFIDNDSKDDTRTKLREICDKNKKIKAIFNVRNFGQNNSPYYGILQTTGDCTISMSCDFQDPVELIPKFIKEWENGYSIVVGVKSSSKENKIMYFFRTLYYHLFQKMSNIDSIEHFTGFGLYDKSFVEVMRKVDDPLPFLRGIVAELGYNIKKVEFIQPERRAGHTNNNFGTLYSIAMRSFTNYTRLGIRAMSIISFIGACVCLIISLFYLVQKILHWNSFDAGMIPLLLVICLLGCFQLFFIGMLGEYMYTMNARILHRPLVIEAERINFDIQNGEENVFK